MDVVAERKNSAHNWWAATLKNLPLGVTTPIRVHMKEQDTANKADVGKWRGMRPVFTYADPQSPATYIGYYQDERGWWAIDPLSSPGKRFAGNGLTPEQDVIPRSLAAKFLTNKGRLWTAWRDIEGAQINSQNNTFTFAPRFERSTATVAMRVPYSYEFLQAFLEQLEAAHLPGVFVDEVGRSKAGRKLQVIRLEPPESTEKPLGDVIAVAKDAEIKPTERPTVVVIAREHATEPDSSWGAHGVLNELLSDTPESRRLRRNMTWLIIPIEDPDGVADSVFDRLTNRFVISDKFETPPEAFAYTRYFVDYVDKQGRTLDVSISLHNVEATENKNFSVPMIHWQFRPQIEAFNRQLFDRLRQAGLQTGEPTTQATGAAPWRLYGWLSTHLGAMDMAFELNSRFPQFPLNHIALQHSGTILAQQMSAWVKSSEGRKWHAELEKYLQEREAKRATLYAAWPNVLPSENSDAWLSVLLTHGYAGIEKRKSPTTQ